MQDRYTDEYINALSAALADRKARLDAEAAQKLSDAAERSQRAADEAPWKSLPVTPPWAQQIR